MPTVAGRAVLGRTAIRRVLGGPRSWRPGPTQLGATVALVVVSTALVPSGILAEMAGAPSARACVPSGQVRLSTKLTCPNSPVDVILTVDPGCPAGEFYPVDVRSLRITNPLPESIIPFADDPGPGRAEGAVPEWTFDSAPADGITVSHRIAAMKAGHYSIGDQGHVEVEDGAGNLSTGRLTPESLVVAPLCGRPTASTLYLPVLHRPNCVPSRLPSDIVVLMDRSGSMAAGGPDAAAANLGVFVAALDLTREQVGLVAFDHRAQLIAPLGSSAAQMRSVLEQAPLAPGTRLDQAIAAGLSELTGERGRRGARRLLILVTDGVQTSTASDRTARAAARRAEQHDVVILSLAVGSTANRELLVELAGGADNLVEAQSRNDYPDAYRRLAGLCVCAGNDSH